MTYFVEIQVPGLPSQQHELLETKTTVGSGPEAQIRLRETSGLCASHLELTAEREGTLVALAADAPGSVVFRGQPGRSFRVPWGEEAYVGSTRLGFVAKERKTQRHGLLLLLPLALLAVGMTVIPKVDGEIDLGADIDPPPLLGATGAPCQERDPGVAGRRAREAERAARAKMERFAFVASEGLAARDLLAESVACYRAAGANTDGERVQVLFDEWSRRMGSEFAAERLRLKVALDGKRHEDALSAVRSLQALLAERPASPYSTWLEDLRRQLERKAAKSGSQAGR